MPRCHYISAASSGIARVYARLLNIEMPHFILNAFPLSQRSGGTSMSDLAEELRAMESPCTGSQVIGQDRSLADGVKALALIRYNIQLQLRGAWANGFESALLGLATRLVSINSSTC